MHNIKSVSTPKLRPADASVTCLPGDTSMSNGDADSSKTLDTKKDTQSNSIKKGETVIFCS